MLTASIGSIWIATFKPIGRPPFRVLSQTDRCTIRLGQDTRIIWWADSRNACEAGVATGPLVQLAAQALQQRRHGVTRGRVVADREIALDRRARRAEIAQMRVQQRGLAP